MTTSPPRPGAAPGFTHRDVGPSPQAWRGDPRWSAVAALDLDQLDQLDELDGSVPLGASGDVRDRKGAHEHLATPTEAPRLPNRGTSPSQSGHFAVPIGALRLPDPGTSPSDQGTSRARPGHFAGIDRVLVLAAHPDDETLGAGGLIAEAAARGLRIDIVLATAGEGSHPDSPTHTAEQLAERRIAEDAEAIRMLAPHAVTRCLRIPDGQVADEQDRLLRRLVEMLGDGRRTLLVTPWAQDGHADHDACGQAAAVAARRTGARLVQFPIWWWQWGAPATTPWSRLRRLPLSPPVQAAKAQAILAHASQVEPLSDQPGDERLLHEEFLAHFRTTDEIYVAVDPTDTALDDLHRRVADPWATAHSWYERRKRDLTLAALPRRDYVRGLEVGCSVGTLAADLAVRCGFVLAVDASPAAIAAAKERTATIGNVRVEQRLLPEEWPPGPFDLIVVSEVGYFLSPRDLDAVIATIRSSLRADGDLVLCHWRHPIDGWPLDGPRVHDRFRENLGRPEVATYRDRDVEISVFSDTPLPEAGAAADPDAGGEKRS